ncbi:MAG: CpaF family protein [Candidatus Micrarchaeota archaeon]|nr:CpaF family protein [Candidatus Micrarchaeota archaeon]
MGFFPSFGARIRLGGQRVAESGVDYKVAPLSFLVSNDYPDSIIESSPSQFREMGKRGRESIYSITASQLSKGDFGIASRVKGEVVDIAIAEDMNAGFSSENISLISKVAMQKALLLTTEDKARVIAYLVAHDVVGYGPLSILLEDSRNIEEIIVNSPTSNIAIYHAKYGYSTTNLRFRGERDFRFIANRVADGAEAELNSLNPIIDAKLLDGSRVHAQLKPYAISGAVMSIRLNSSKKVTLKKLVETATASPETLAYLWMAVEARLNIIVSGAPASGKTSLLLCVSQFIPKHSRVVTIEESVNELDFSENFSNLVQLNGNALGRGSSIKDQIVNALHLRPERIIVGEIRGPETREVFSGANLGVPFMTTMHSSENGLVLLNRLSAKPMSVEPQAINMLDMSVVMEHPNPNTRRLSSITEYSWLVRGEAEPEKCAEAAGQQLIVNDIVRDGVMVPDALKNSKAVSAFAKMYTLSRSGAMSELKRRAKFIAALPDASPREISDIFDSYGAIG